MTESIQARNKIVVLVSVFALALTLRIAFSLTLGDNLYWSDEHQYLKGVESVVDRGEWYLTSSYKPPGYVYFLVVVRLLFGDSIMAIRMVHAVLGAMVCVLTLMLGTRLFSRKVGVVAATYAAFYPLLIYISGMVLAQAVEAFVITGAVFLLILYRDYRKTWILAACGVLIGLCALAVPLIVFLVPTFALWLFGTRGWTFLPAFRESLVLGACALCMILPWTIRNYVVEKRLILIATLGNQLLYLHNNPWADPDNKALTRAKAFEIKDQVRAEALARPGGATEDQIYMRKFKEFVREHPGRFAVLYLKKFRNFFSLYPQTFSENVHTGRRDNIISILSYGPVLIFSLLGAAVSIRKNREALLLVAVPVVFAMGYSVFHTTVRYRIPTEPCAIIMASYGFLWLLSRTGWSRQWTVGGDA